MSGTRRPWLNLYNVRLKPGSKRRQQEQENGEEVVEEVRLPCFVGSSVGIGCIWCTV
jgi:hypothetical protein